MENMNLEKQKDAIINRVFAGGKDIEKKEIIRFYGLENINKIFKTHGI